MAKFKKFRRRPAIIAAVQWTGENSQEVFELVGLAYDPSITNGCLSFGLDLGRPQTVELRLGDWVTREVRDLGDGMVAVQVHTAEFFRAICREITGRPEEQARQAFDNLLQVVRGDAYTAPEIPYIERPVTLAALGYLDVVAPIEMSRGDTQPSTSGPGDVPDLLDPSTLLDEARREYEHALRSARAAREGQENPSNLTASAWSQAAARWAEVILGLQGQVEARVDMPERRPGSVVVKRKGSPQ